MEDVPAAPTEPIEIAMIGGGKDSFMGPVHRAAIAKAGGFRLVAGAFGSSRQSSYDTGEALGLAGRSVYGHYRDFFRHQQTLPPARRVAFAAAVLPNTMHYPVAMLAMDSGIPVLGEKPFTCNLDEATNLCRKQHATGVPYRIAMVYPAYTMLAEARRLVHEGTLGTLRRFVFTYTLGWMARRVENLGNRQALWRVDEHRNGPAGVVTDLGCHCQFACEWLTGLRISEVAADGHPAVPGRLMPDDCAVLVRTESGPHGTFLLSQVATGHREGLAFELTGDKAALRWCQSEPARLVLTDLAGSEKLFTDASASGIGTDTDRPFGDNAAYIAALADVYCNFAAELVGKEKGTRHGFAGLTPAEGLRSVAFTDAIVRSLAASSSHTAEGRSSVWIPVEVPSF